MIDTSKLIWQDLSCLRSAPKKTVEWLNDEASLTAKLKQKFSDFSVKVISQQQGQPHANEVEIINTKSECVIREVALLGNNKIVVYARSIIPLTSDTKDILNIGSKPLGEVLFNDTHIKRDSMQITQSDQIWGRRSAFTIGNSKILVSEFFMEDLYA